MFTKENYMNRWELEQIIVLKALKDPAFKKRLLGQPKEALRDFLKDEKGIDLTGFDTLNVRVIEEQKEEWVLALPSLPAEMASMTEEQIEKVVAGCGCATVAITRERP
jgi:hypothetical protein